MLSERFFFSLHFFKSGSPIFDVSIYALVQDNSLFFDIHWMEGAFVMTAILIITP